MPGERFMNTYRDGDWSVPSDDPASPWYDSADGPQGSLAAIPQGGRGKADQDNPTAGDTVIISHAVAVDIDAACGDSYQGEGWSRVAFSATEGAVVTKLATGSYRASYAIRSKWDTYGFATTSAGATESALVSITNGTSRPRVTFPASPPAGCTYDLYLTSTAGTAGTGRRYCGEITGTYVDLVSDKWGNDYSGGLAVNGTAAFAAAFAPTSMRNVSALTIASTGSLAIAAGKILTLRGNLIVESPALSSDDWITVGAGATFGFDSSLAIAPAQAEYIIYFEGGGKIAWSGS
jgi:hypothetical protein